MSDAKLESLIAQCKNNDVDIKVDALTKLQAEFEAGIEIADPDPLISVLKTCLRTPNQHLTTATLSALPPLLPLIISRPGSQQFVHSAQPISASSSTSSVTASSLIDAATLRQVVVAFLPAGGVLDRLGDNRDKAREKARETMVVLGGLAFRGGGASSSAKSKGSGTETPLMMFERYLREGGLASKVWRVREQSILTLLHIRRAHHLFPIRPYLPQLVATLEDTDGNVRECARQSVVELFTGPGVTDGARADLKKEMTKKGVRKNIVDAVLAKLVAGGGGTASYPTSEGSENGDTGGKKDYIPPSLALQGRKPTVALGASTGPAGIPRAISYGTVRELPRPASRSAVISPPPPPMPSGGEAGDVRPVYITSIRDMESEFESMLKPYEGKETEHNWAAREKAIQRVRGMLKGDVHARYPDAFIACLKEGFIKWSLKALASLRTTVASNTSALYSELAVALGPAMDPFCETLLTPLLRMASFTKKIAAQQSQAAVTTILTHTSAQPRTVLPLLSTTLQEKTVQARAFVIAHIKNYLEVHGTRSKNIIESSGGAEILEKCMKRSLADANIGVREHARVCFWVFESVWHDRGLAILGTLDSLARKQLEKVCPDPLAASAILPPTTPKNTKKTSVAAAIAASRAKAKAIATSPPTLRHQATSTSHAVRAASPTPLGPRASLSPPTSPRSRIVSSTPMTRTISTPGAHSRSPSSSSTSTPPESIRRVTSSPLAGSPPRTSVLRRATQTALPASPPPLSAALVQHSPIYSSPTARRASTSRVPAAAVPVPSRPSTIVSLMNGNNDESLLLATGVPIPEDSDSDPDESVNLMSFSTPFEVYPPFPIPTPKANSEAHSFSPKSVDSRQILSNALSTPEHVQGEVVEDALRARAEQAESAAERLLELVDPEDNVNHYSTIPPSLLLGTNGNGNHATPNPKTTYLKPPVTPLNRNTAILKQAALFKNSPAYNGTSPSLLDVLKDRKNESSWWLKRMTMVEHGTPLKAVSSSDRTQELKDFITALEQRPVSVRVLRKLALLCIENPVHDPSSPSSSFSMPGSPSPFEARVIPSLHADIWNKDKNFERLFNALIAFLDPSRGEEELEYGLIVLWEMLDHQALYIDGREADIFTVLLTIRYCNKLNVMEATNTIRDALALRIEPVYGLTTMHASLRAFYATAHHPSSDNVVKAASYAFGMIALGKFILRLPAEVLEEELPRIKGTLIMALNDKTSLVIRESAAASIIAAQLVLRDETHLFALLDGLADDKKNLLTYLFDKHGTMGHTLANGSGMEKLEKEMRRLDTRTNASPRPSTSTHP